MKTDDYNYDAMPTNEERLRYADNPFYVFTSTKDAKYKTEETRLKMKKYWSRKPRGASNEED